MGEVARVTEITARSEQSFEDAIKTGIERATQTLRHVSGAWIKEQKVEIEEGRIKAYHVDMLITFVLEDSMSGNGHERSQATAGQSGQQRGQQQGQQPGTQQTAGQQTPQAEGVPH